VRIFKLTVAIAALLVVGFFVSVVPAFSQVDTAWVRRYDGPASGEDKAVALAVDRSGNVYVTGESPGSGTLCDFATIKYLSTGDTAWVRRYNGAASGEDKARAMAVDDSGNVYVAGSSWGGATDSDYLTIKYDPDGTQVWARRYDGPASGEDEAYALALDDSGSVYVTGASSGSGTSQDYATIKYHPNGDTTWVVRYNGPANGFDQACAVDVDDSQNVYVTGYSWGGLDNFDYATVKYGSGGNQVWARRYDGATNGEDRAAALAVDDGGSVYVTGYSNSAASLRDYVTVKYLPDGDTAWIVRYNGPANDRDETRALAVDPWGGACVTGFSWDSPTNLDYATVRYLPGGDTAWVRRYNGPDNEGDGAEAIAVDAAGCFYVTGASSGGTSQDYATVKYLPQGDMAWVRRYDGRANGSDQASAIATDDLGNVYVTGCSWSSGTSFDYATIKYAPSPQVPISSCPGHWVLITLLSTVALRALQRRTSAVRSRR
jgi:uncharacterized protein (UPF0297 family)